MKLTLFIFLFIFSIAGNSQNCTAPGQNPSTAFPVCGTSTFVQNTVPLCGGRALPSPACPGNGLTDINPFWYKFTCFKAGTLAFEITPNNLGDDYDWELYDVTNKNPNDIYTDGSMVVTCNWSGESGKTGASAAGTQLMVCGGYGKPLYSRMATLQVNHNYILLISHFTNSQSGYSLAFGGGTAVITDTTLPRLQVAEANCGGDMLKLKLNKKVKCSSISGAGSEFYITPAGATVNNVTGINCSSQFDTDSLHIQLSQPLSPGNYTLHVKQGSDNNTLLDYCDNSIPVSDQVNFTILSNAPTPFDSLAPVTCAPMQLQVVLKKPVLCNTIAPDGSDFIVQGSYPVGITAATANCTNGTTRTILVTLNATLKQAGNFTLMLQQGRDGNTIIDECAQQTPAGSAIAFGVKDTVNADFTYTIRYGCTTDSVQFVHPAGNGINRYTWNLDEGMNSTMQNPLALYKVFNTKNVVLEVSNGFCKDSSIQAVALNNFLQADFTVFEDNCPNEPVMFTNTSVGKIKTYSWSFGDGGISSNQSPTHVFAVPQSQTPFTVKLQVTDSIGCQQSLEKRINIYTSCYLAVPTGFTPNNDGRNDFMRPLNAIRAEQLDFQIYNRWGQMVFKTNDWKRGWDGKQNGLPQASGTYVWLLKYTDRDTKKKVEQKGTVVLIR